MTSIQSTVTHWQAGQVGHKNELVWNVPIENRKEKSDKLMPLTVITRYSQWMHIQVGVP
jgi:hypothetical protein